MRKFLSLLLALLMLPLPGALAAEKYETLPEHMQMTQSFEHERLGNNVSIDRAWPVTVNESVNAELRAALDQLETQGRAFLPARATRDKEGALLDVGATVYRTGESWASFLMTASVQDDRKQIYTAVDTRAYDLLTGKAITLFDVIADEAGWQIVADAVRAQASAYFPGEPADEARLDALTQDLASAPFTLTVAYLQLHFRADRLYDGKQTLMHVRVPYAALAGHLTSEALRQTDNSRYKMVALTFDDGPTRSVTLRVMRNLRRGCAEATFFIVGERIPYGPEYLAMQHDAGFITGSHNYVHDYPYQVKGKVIAYRDQLNEKLTAVTGRGVSIMRAPGGDEKVYINEDVYLPLIHWTLVSADAGGNVKNPESEARRLASKALDGDVILCHDLRSGTADYTQTLPQLLAARGFLCVTVEELFAVNGIELAPNTVYFGVGSDSYEQRKD